MKRVSPSLVLLLIAPLISEFLLGNLPLDQAGSLAAYPALVLLYGAGAGLIREVTRRRSRGYPTIVGLAVAYGILEEGIVTQSLFNPGYQGLGLRDYGQLDPPGLNVPWTLFVLTVHSVWSIVVPIALVEGLFWERRDRRWLDAPGLVMFGVLYLAGFAALMAGSIYSEKFLAGPGQLAAAALAAVLAVTVALGVPRRPGTGPAATSPVWPPAALALFALLGGSLFFLLFHLGATRRLLPAPVEAAGTAAVLGVTVLVLARQVRRAGWSGRHHLALLAGALATYCWAGFLVQISHYGFRPVSTAIQVGLVLGALGLLAAARTRVGREAAPTGTAGAATAR